MSPVPTPADAPTASLRELAADFRQRAEQTAVAFDEGGQREDECDSPAECHASAQYLTWKLAARALEKLISSPGWGAAVATPQACADGPTCPEHGNHEALYASLAAPASPVGDTGDSELREDAEDRETADSLVPKRQWQPGDIAYDRTRFVWVRYEAGWRTYPRTTGTQYGDAHLEAEAGPLTRLHAVPEGTGRLGNLPADFPALLSTDTEATDG
mgnify:CR=1 FL=1